MVRTKPAAMRDDVLWFLDTTFGSWNWAHKAVRDALKGLTPREAARAHSHSLWEQIGHIAHWKRYSVQRIRGGRPRADQAWPAPGRTARELRQSIAVLTRLHDDLRTAVLDIRPEAFAQSRTGKHSLVRLLLSATTHESYHVLDPTHEETLPRRTASTVTSASSRH